MEDHTSLANADPFSSATTSTSVSAPVSLKVLGITSVNCEPWVATDLAANLIGVTTVPLYETLGTQIMTLILEQTEMSTIFGSDKCLMNVLNVATESVEKEERPRELRFLTHFVLFDEPSEALTVLC